MTEIIRSKDNRICKACQRLQQRKYRDRTGLCLIEGVHLIREAPRDRLEWVLLREDTALPIPAAGVPVYRMASPLFDRLAPTETSQGILAAVRRPEDDLQTRLFQTGQNSNIVVLDRLQDPGNIGTIIRTAEGAGYAAVIAVRGTADLYAPKTIRAAAGSIFRIPLLQAESGRTLAALLRQAGKRLVVTAPDADADYFDTDLSRNIALVIGNEGNGVSDELAALADVRVRIPMQGSLESLNASVAAAILMYEAQRRAAHAE